MRQDISTCESIGSEYDRPTLLAWLAEGYRRAGQSGEGLIALAEAMALVDQTGERWFEAEIWRLKGKLLLAQGEDTVEAERCFATAVQVARSQSARSLELRATMSLCRLWQKQGKGKQARQALEPIYGWLTEGFDTADLQEAKALLDELSLPEDS